MPGRYRAALVVIAAVLAATPPAGAEALRVGDAAAPPGQKASGWIVVPDGSDPGTRIPVTVVHGARPGNVLALVAGTHGYEYTSIMALPRVLARLDPARMTGSVILVHMANPPAFYGRRVYVGPDGKNLNRVYPGRADGTVERPHRPRHHHRGHRQGHPPGRHALRRRQRVAAALHATGR